MKAIIFALAALVLSACGDESYDDDLEAGDGDEAGSEVDEMDYALRLSWLDLKTRLFCPRPGSVSLGAWESCRAGVANLGLSQAYLNAANFNPTADHRHAGIDIGGQRLVYSPVAGTVRDAANLCGKVVIQDDRVLAGSAQAPRHVFLHMTAIRVAVGQRVQPGTQLGTSGSVGGGGCVVSGAHLHYEIRKNYAGTSAVGSTSGSPTSSLTYDPLVFEYPAL